MAGKSFWKLCAILPLIFFGQWISAQDTAVIHWYVDNHPEVWILQKDVVGFISKDKIHTESSGIINKTESAGTNGNIQVVHFRKNSSAESKARWIESLTHQGSVKKLFAISKPVEAGSPFAAQLLFIDDQVMVVFKAAPSASELEAFAGKYNLDIVSKPDIFNNRDNGVYVFRYSRFTENDNSATISSAIYEGEKGKVLVAHPNRVNLFGAQSTNDTYIDLAWHVSNNGQQLSCNSLQGQHHADAHIAGAWALGYSGQGIKVGVIDFFGFDYHHPDMQGQFLPGWDCINNTAYDESNFYFTDATQAHGMSVCGVIGALADNSIGSAGVAFGAKIVPFLIDGSEVSVVLAMQKARSAEFDVDVVNCSFGSYFPSPAIQAEVENLVNYGRVRNGIPLGVTVVTSHGNDNYSDIEHPQYPAAYDEVISVSASTPDDKRKTPGDSWETTGSWGSNYGALLDIAAPGVCIFTTDISGQNGYSISDYVAFQKTSASAPIVSGVAAIVLSKYPNLNWQDLRALLRSSADKTNSVSEGGGYNYNYDENKPGQSMEMGYGRVNAEKAVAGIPVGIAEETRLEKNAQFTVSSFVQNTLDILYSLDVKNNYEMAVFDMSGRMLLNVALPAGSGKLNLDVSRLTSGMYFVKCISGAEVISNEKFIKVR